MVTGPPGRPQEYSSPPPPPLLPLLEVPPVELLPMELPPVELPVVDVPPLELPPLEVPPVEVPPVELAPVEVPVLELPVLELPLLELAPVGVPVLELPVLELPLLEVLLALRPTSLDASSSGPSTAPLPQAAPIQTRTVATSRTAIARDPCRKRDTSGVSPSARCLIKTSRLIQLLRSVVYRCAQFRCPSNAACARSHFRTMSSGTRHA